MIKVQKNLKVKCLICGERHKRLAGGHIERKHNLSKEEYSKRFPNAKIISDEAKKLQSKIQKELFKNPKLRKKVGGRTFDFINDKKLVSLLQRDYKAAKKCLENELWKPCIILYGGIIEAVLRDVTNIKSFYKALKFAENKKIILRIDYHKIHIIRDLRNYVHLHKELSEEIEINENWANTFSDICESIIKHFKK